jgi:putative membrane protein
MTALLASATISDDVWRFRAHPEVWVLMLGLIGSYVYMVRVVGPRVVPHGPAVTKRQVAAFTAAMALLWLASDWPLHDLGEEHLYSAHMLQHMMLSYFAPPLFLIATPEWLMRTLIGDGRGYRVVRWFTRPVTAAVLFNLSIMITHIPGVVNSSVENGPLHYSLHVMVVTLSLLMWMPVCGPLPEMRLTPAGKMIYLFAQSIVPTVPAGWLTFADGVVYKAYDHGPRVFGLSVTDDQQLAGVIMKIGGSIFLWTLVTVLFFKRFMANWEQENSYARRRVPDAEITGNAEEALTYAQVEQEFERVPPVPEPEHPATPT